MCFCCLATRATPQTAWSNHLRNIAEIETNAFAYSARQQHGCQPSGFQPTALLAGACGAAMDHSTEPSRQLRMRSRSPSTGAHSLQLAGHGRQLRGPNRRRCGQAAATVAFSRVGLVVLATSQDVLHDGFTLRLLRWDGPQRRASSSHLTGPPIGPAAAAITAKLSLLCRERFWSAILGAAFGGHMGDSRARANRRSCGLASAATATNHSAKLPWAQGAAF